MPTTKENLSYIDTAYNILFYGDTKKNTEHIKQAHQWLQLFAVGDHNFLNKLDQMAESTKNFQAYNQHFNELNYQYEVIKQAFQIVDQGLGTDDDLNLPAHALICQISRQHGKQTREIAQLWLKVYEIKQFQETNYP